MYKDKLQDSSNSVHTIFKKNKKQDVENSPNRVSRYPVMTLLECLVADMAWNG